MKWFPFMFKKMKPLEVSLEGFIYSSSKMYHGCYVWFWRAFATGLCLECFVCLFISWVRNGGPCANLMAACFVNKVLLKHSHPYLFYYLSLLHTAWQNWVLPAKPETFTIWPLTEEACQSFRFRELGTKGYHEAPTPYSWITSSNLQPLGVAISLTSLWA